MARQALAPLCAEPTQRVAMLMAELEELEHGDVGRAREWMARALRAPRDPVWTADGIVSEHWLPASPVTGRIDAFEWKVPVAELPARDAGAERVSPSAIEARPVPTASAAREPSVAPPAGPAPPPAAERSEQQRAGSGDGRAPATPIHDLGPAAPGKAQHSSGNAVIPLVHAPDDPGPEGEALAEEETEPETEKDESWRPFGSLFR